MLPCWPRQSFTAARGRQLHLSLPPMSGPFMSLLVTAMGLQKIAAMRVDSSLGEVSNLSLSERSAWSCCCKHVSPADADKDCAQSKRTTDGGLYFYNADEEKCCKLVGSLTGCFLHSGYDSNPRSQYCSQDVRPASSNTCCKVSSTEAFYVNRLVRFGRWAADGNMREWQTHSVVNVRDNAGATHDREGGTVHISPEDVAEYFKDGAAKGKQFLACSMGLEVGAESCDISSGIRDRCCCAEEQVWYGEECLALIAHEEGNSSTPPTHVQRDEVWWELAEQQVYSECTDWQTRDVEVLVPELKYYDSTCPKQVYECTGQFHVSPALNTRQCRWVTKQVPCKKSRVIHKKVMKPEQFCAYAVEKQYCPGAHEFFYKRQVPYGVCHTLDTLVASSIGKYRCPDGHISEGVRRKMATCICDGPC